MNRHHRKAFTLLEVLITVGIIVLLIAMLGIGFGKIQSNARKRTTVQMLTNCRAVLTEFERLTQGKQLPKLVLVAPKQVGEGAADRDGPAVKQTRAVMTLLQSHPSNKTALDQLPSINRWASTVPGEGPIILDGWGNPILYVPAAGMSQVKVGATIQIIKSLDDLPFFASAGPDGSFETGDDNVYSFNR